MLFPNLSLYETPIVDVINAERIKSPLTVLFDFSFSSVSKIALKFLINLSSANDFFPLRIICYQKDV